MSSGKPAACERFEQWLLGGDIRVEDAVWDAHLADCSACREQWQAHRLLAEAFAGRTVPELTPAFDAALRRKLATARVEVRALRGWRSVAMVAYVIAAVGALAWVLRDMPLPAIDFASPWVLLAVLVAVPLSFLVAITTSRWLPGPALPSGPRLLAP